MLFAFILSGRRENLVVEEPKKENRTEQKIERERQNPMVEPLEAAAVADDLSLLDFIDQNPPQKPCSRTETALKNPNALVIFDELLDSSVDSIHGLPSPPTVKRSPACDELNEAAVAEEEELEWLSNKDAFPSLETSFEITTNNASPVSVLPPSFKVPVKARSKLRRKKRRIFPPIRAATPLPPPPPPPAGKERRRCRHCEVEETPQWRMGPEGPKTLCNACGVRFKKGRLFPEYRPANSPTFSAAIHSNSTRRIVEMRLGTGRPGKRGRLRLAVM